MDPMPHPCSVRIRFGRTSHVTWSTTSSQAQIAEAIAWTCWWSVPQHPPTTRRSGRTACSRPYQPARSPTSPRSSSVATSSSAWLQLEALARIAFTRASHAELDEALELDRGDPDDLASRYLALRDLLPGLHVVGGCCGTDHQHVQAIASAICA